MLSETTWLISHERLSPPKCLVRIRTILPTWPSMPSYDSRLVSRPPVVLPHRSTSFLIPSLFQRKPTSRPLIPLPPLQPVSARNHNRFDPPFVPGIDRPRSYPNYQKGRREAHRLVLRRRCVFFSSSGHPAKPDADAFSIRV